MRGVCSRASPACRTDCSDDRSRFAAIWRDPTPLRVLGTGAALPGEPIATEELLTTVDPLLLGATPRRAGNRSQARDPHAPLVPRHGWALGISAQRASQSRTRCRLGKGCAQRSRPGGGRSFLSHRPHRDTGPPDTAKHRLSCGAAGLRRPLRRISPGLHRVCQRSGVRAGIAARGSGAGGDRWVRNGLSVF